MSNDIQPSSSPPPARHDHAFYVRGLGDETDAYLAALAAGPLDSAVPSCPGWSVYDLVTHLGRVQRWVTHLVTTRAEAFVSSKTLAIEFPEPSGDVIGWARAGADELRGTLTAAPPDTPVWSWGPDQHVRFWSRRQCHEAAIHRADAELARGQRPVIARDVALDAIDELLELVTTIPDLPAKLAVDGHRGDRLHLHATDRADTDTDGGDTGRGGAGRGEWTIEITDDGFNWAHDHAKGDVAVRATASDLVLALYGRIPTDDPALTCFGDLAVFDHWRSVAKV
jgi:uncharacterized protein (TIGR03083 family)